MTHPIVEQAYTKAGIEYRPETTDLHYQDWKRKTRGSKIRRRINQMWRIKSGVRDYLMYEETLFALDLMGNEEPYTAMVGKIHMPVFQKKYDEDSGKVVAVSVSRVEPIYIIPFTPKKAKEILDSGDVPHETAFTVDLGHMKWGGVSAHEFLTRHFDDLYAKATTGRYLNDTPKPLPPDSEVEAAHKRELKKRGVILNPTKAARASRREIEAADDDDDDDDEKESSGAEEEDDDYDDGDKEFEAEEEEEEEETSASAMAFNSDPQALIEKEASKIAKRSRARKAVEAAATTTAAVVEGSSTSPKLTTADGGTKSNTNTTTVDDEEIT